MKNLLERREFQGRLLSITNYELRIDAPVLRECLLSSVSLFANFCGVTSFSAGFFDVEVRAEDSFPVSVRLGNVASLFLPAAGNRNNTNGNVNNVGTNGNYWSSNINGTNGRNLNFNSGNFNMNNDNRAYGFTVRCVAALNTNDFWFSEEILTAPPATDGRQFPFNKLKEWLAKRDRVVKFEQQLKYDLFQAYFDARKNKRNTWNQLRFEIEFEHNLLLMYERILDRSYEIKKSIGFIITQPVMREIFAADFSDRIVHHLIFNYINPILDKQFIPDSYSCRKSKGTLYGIKRMESFIKACSENYTKDCYILKLDIKGYFMGMNKHSLIQKLHNMLDNVRYTPFSPEDSSHCWNDCFDFDLVWWLIEKVIWNDPTQSCIIKSQMSDWDDLPPTKSLFHTAPDCGLPIGNLTSQLFSNVYLRDFDCFVKNDLGIEYYDRYVDDFIIVHPDKAFLLDILPKIKQYLVEHAQLQLHPNKIYLQHYSKGVSFLGAYIKPHRCYVNNRTKKKFYGALREIDEILSEEEVQRKDLEKVRAKLNSYLGIMKHHRTYNIKSKALMRPNKFFKYGYLKNRLSIYCISRKHLKKIV
jgi:hypothetical protein